MAVSRTSGTNPAPIPWILWEPDLPSDKTGDPFGSTAITLTDGFLLFRYGKISVEGSKTLGNILIYVSLPAVIINSFLIERTPEHMAVR